MMGRTREFLVRWRRQLLILLLPAAGFLVYRLLGLDRYLDLAYVTEQRWVLRSYVEQHYWISALVFILLYVSTAFFVPGAIVLTLAGGFLFGVLPAALYVNAGAVIGAVLALQISRRLAGNWIQERYADQLEPFNRAIERHGVHYLMALRIIPVLPFFAVNYLAGLTRIPLGTFVWTTSLGILPGSLVYAYAGRELGSITRPGEILSPGVIAALVLLGVLILLPPLYRKVRGSWKDY